MNLRSLFLACRILLGWAAALAIVFATEGQAAPLVVGTDYIETRHGACSTSQSTNACVVPFTAVPANKELLVTRVACALHISGASLTNTVAAMWLGERSRQGGTLEPHTYLIPVHLATNAVTFQVHQSNNETSHPFIAGMRPQVGALTNEGTFQALNCTLMGKYRDVLVP